MNKPDGEGKLVMIGPCQPTTEPPQFQTATHYDLAGIQFHHLELGQPVSEFSFTVSDTATLLFLVPVFNLLQLFTVISGLQGTSEHKVHP